MKSQSKQPQTALQKMQEIAERLTSNTPELLKYMDNESILRKKEQSGGMGATGKLKKGENSQGLGFKNEMTSNDYFQKCKEIMAELTIYKDKNVKLENDLEVYKQRFVEREIEYRKIIQELQQELRNKSMLDPNEKARMQQIFELHGKILENISTIQNKTSKILVQQESDIIRFFHKKINEIKEKFKEERINKGEKDQEHIQKEKQLISELEWMKNIAQKIDTQNQTLVKKYAELKSQFEIQQNDRDMLVRELLMKKKKNAVLTNQIQQYEKLLQEVSREVDEQQANAPDRLDSVDNQSAINLNVTHQSTNKFKQLSREEEGDPKRAMNTINTLKQTLGKEQKRVRELKNLYMRQIQSRTELQKILRKLVDDIKEEIMEVRAEVRNVRKKQDDFGKEARTVLIEKLLNNQKILTLIYDKTFYSDIKKGDFSRKDKVTEEPELEMEGFDDSN